MANGFRRWDEWAFAQLLNGPIERTKLRAGMMPLIPPGVAFRYTESDREYKRKKHVPISDKRQPRRETPEHVTIEIGRGLMTNGAIASHLRSHRYIAYVTGGKEYIALGPRAVIGPVQRIAKTRCRQSHNWWNGESEYNPCPIWHEHIREAIELWNAAGAPSTRKYYKTRQADEEDSNPEHNRREALIYEDTLKKTVE